MAKKEQSREVFEKELHRKYLQLQLYKHQLNALIEEKNNMESRVAEARMTLGVLEELGKIKKNSEAWSPIGSNAFAICDVKDTENVLINVGAGVLVKSTKQRSIEIISERLEEMNSVNKTLDAEIIKYSEEVARLEPEVQRMAQQL